MKKKKKSQIFLMNERLQLASNPPTPACTYWIFSNIENKFNTSADTKNYGFCVNYIQQPCIQLDENELKVSIFLMNGRLQLAFNPPTPACTYWILINFKNKFTTSANTNNCGFCLNYIQQPCTTSG